MQTHSNRLRYAAAAALTTGLLVPVAVFAGPGFAHGSASAAQYQYGGGKVTICHHAGSHKTVTISVSKNALKAHKKHGDTEGACPTTTTTSTTTATSTTAAPTAAAPSTSPGNGHGKAKGHSK